MKGMTNVNGLAGQRQSVWDCVSWRPRTRSLPGFTRAGKVRPDSQHSQSQPQAGSELDTERRAKSERSRFRRSSRRKLKAWKAKSDTNCELVFPTTLCNPRLDFLDCLKACARTRRAQQRRLLAAQVPFEVCDSLPAGGVDLRTVRQ